MNIGPKRDLIWTLQDQVQKFDSVARNKIALDEFYKRARLYFQKMFGEDSLPLGELQILYESLISVIDFDGDLYHQYLQKFKNFFDDIEKEIELELDAKNSKNNIQISEVSTPLSNKVFIVHGHDDAMKLAVARVLEQLGLEPIILHEQPNQGLTIIEKFSAYADVSFAVVLLSADDKGYAKDENPKQARYRARQNVILELGYFLGQLKRKNVTVLHTMEPNFEPPSDYNGVMYTPFDSAGSWKIKLAKELKAHGFDIDVDKLIAYH